MKAAFIEVLEPRQLLSVSGTTLAGPITVGSQWNYQSTQGGKVMGTVAIKIAGTAMVNGIKTTERDTTTTQPGGSTVSKSFFTLTASKGAVQYKSISTTMAGPVTLFTTTSTYTPYETIFPASIKGGQTLTFTWTSKNVSTLTGTTTTTSKLQIKLVSETEQTITTPAGKFKVYQVDNTLTQNTGGKTTSSTFDDWIAPGIGIVKQVSGSGATAHTSVLTSYKIK